MNRRRPRCAERVVAKFNDVSYAYRVRSKSDETDKKIDVQVCYKDLISLHGISPRRVQTIRSSLKLNRKPPNDGSQKQTS